MIQMVNVDDCRLNKECHTVLSACIAVGQFELSWGHEQSNFSTPLIR
jgi:hypothetical protein